MFWLIKFHWCIVTSTHAHTVAHGCCLATMAELNSCDKPTIFVIWPRKFANPWLTNTRFCFLLPLPVHLWLAGPLPHHPPSGTQAGEPPMKSPLVSLVGAGDSRCSAALQSSTRKRHASPLSTDLWLNQVLQPSLTSRGRKVPSLHVPFIENQK